MNRNEKHVYKMTDCPLRAHNTSALERDVNILKKGLVFYTQETHYERAT